MQAQVDVGRATFQLIAGEEIDHDIAMIDAADRAVGTKLEYDTTRTADPVWQPGCRGFHVSN